MIPTWITVVACALFVVAGLWILKETHEHLPEVIWARRKVQRFKVKLAKWKEARLKRAETERFRHHRWRSTT